MSELTPNLKLFKYDTLIDGKEVFSIDKAINDNWNILDKAIVSDKDQIITSKKMFKSGLQETNNSSSALFFYQHNAADFGSTTYANSLHFKDEKENSIAFLGGVQTTDGKGGFRLLGHNGTEWEELLATYVNDGYRYKRCKRFTATNIQEWVFNDGLKIVQGYSSGTGVRTITYPVAFTSYTAAVFVQLLGQQSGNGQANFNWLRCFCPWSYNNTSIQLNDANGSVVSQYFLSIGY